MVQAGEYEGNRENITDKSSCNLGKIKIDDSYSSHTLRHGKCTELIRDDFSISKISELVGHKTQKITEDYSHLISSDIEDLIYN